MGTSWEDTSESEPRAQAFPNLTCAKRVNYAWQDLIRHRLKTQWGKGWRAVTSANGFRVLQQDHLSENAWPRFRRRYAITLLYQNKTDGLNFPWSFSIPAFEFWGVSSSLATYPRLSHLWWGWGQETAATLPQARDSISILGNDNLRRRHDQGTGVPQQWMWPNAKTGLVTSQRTLRDSGMSS